MSTDPLSIRMEESVFRRLARDLKKGPLCGLADAPQSAECRWQSGNQPRLEGIWDACETMETLRNSDAYNNTSRDGADHVGSCLHD